MKNTNWKKIKDENVKNVWVCEKCGVKVDISPEWYANNGTPMCAECDEDMSYSHTEIKQ